MLTDEELLELLRDGESDRVEFAESGKDKDKICEAICAFANDMPGHGLPGIVFVGVDDKGKLTGRLKVDDLLLRNLRDWRTNGNIHPFPSMTVQKRRLAGADVAVVIVEPSTMPPVLYKGRCHIRTGPSRDIATVEQERRLNDKSIAAARTFDRKPVLPRAGLEELDLASFREYLPLAMSADTLAENNRGVEDQLRPLKFMNNGDDVTNAGILCFGKKPTDWLPGAYIQFVRFAGTDESSPIKHHREIHGTILSQIRQAEEMLANNITVPAIIGSPRRVDFPDYPFEALRQMLHNAVLHRNYDGTNAPVKCNWFSDRVEIHNPGGPYGDVTVDVFGDPGIADYRNPKLAEVMKESGVIEKCGVGIMKARNAMRENGNPDLELLPRPTWVTAILRRAEAAPRMRDWDAAKERGMPVDAE